MMLHSTPSEAFEYSSRAASCIVVVQAGDHGGMSDHEQVPPNLGKGVTDA